VLEYFRALVLHLMTVALMQYPKRGLRGKGATAIIIHDPTRPASATKIQKIASHTPDRQRKHQQLSTSTNNTAVHEKITMVRIFAAALAATTILLGTAQAFTSSPITISTSAHVHVAKRQQRRSLLLRRPVDTLLFNRSSSSSVNNDDATTAAASSSPASATTVHRRTRRGKQLVSQVRQEEVTTMPQRLTPR
jgi:hypothetical protein